ncbi:Limbic system-associated membrane protein [Takifugu flavidus]|uniref:Limbic system-associated membrane protein n=1 Tax=Takifugu flavidus TaxID=433684 RepID=A0A5C6PCI6_9TELE|nr:Limbic system-associated membrane protein [Takifugu flavidus]
MVGGEEERLHYFWIYNRDALLFALKMLLGRRSCWRQLQASFFRLLCLLPTGFPVRSVDMQRTTDNITIRQGDTAVIRAGKLLVRCEDAPGEGAGASPTASGSVLGHQQHQSADPAGQMSETA